MQGIKSTQFFRKTLPPAPELPPDQADVGADHVGAGEHFGTAARGQAIRAAVVVNKTGAVPYDHVLVVAGFAGDEGIDVDLFGRVRVVDLGGSRGGALEFKDPEIAGAKGVGDAVGQVGHDRHCLVTAAVLNK